MIDHVVKKHVTLRTAAPVKGPESGEERLIGDTAGWGEAGSGTRPEDAAGSLQPGAFLQATAQWKAEGLSKADAPPQST